MNELLHNLTVLMPELKETFNRRYQLLRVIETAQPIGRRALANYLQLSERLIRNDADLLKDQELIYLTNEGMKISEKGINILESFHSFVGEFTGMASLEKELRNVLELDRVVVIQSPIEDNELLLNLLGKAAANLLNKMLVNCQVLGITGGTSVKSIIDNFPHKAKAPSELSIVPARGGVGKSTDFQANTLIEALAKKIGAKYFPLYTPDFLSKETIENLKEEPGLKTTIDLIDNIDVLVFGIGKADVMARRRNISEEEISHILDSGAVSEAFGYYFNAKGEIVHEISTIGIKLNKFKELEKLIAVAAGPDKAQAIVSISKINKNLVLVTDEHCARQIVTKFKEDK